MQYFSHNLKNLNAEQTLAVQNILDATSFPLPFVLFGPPGLRSLKLYLLRMYVTFVFVSIKGTGKTRTLVAAIEQIIGLTDKNVLVCAQSNSACDEIAERLIRHNPTFNQDQMFRMYAFSHDIQRVNADIEPYSNWNGKEFHYPDVKFLMQFRVIICTLCTAGTLARANLPPRHFSYVFIDECASSHQSLCLLPIVGEK